VPIKSRDYDSRPLCASTKQTPISFYSNGVVSNSGSEWAYQKQFIG